MTGAAAGGKRKRNADEAQGNVPLIPTQMTVAYQRPEKPGSKVMVAEMDHTVKVPSLDGMPPGTLLVKVLATSICGSDLAGRCCATCAVGQWRGYTDEMNAGTMARPGGTGHEILGEVVDRVAPSSRSIGQRVLAFSTGYIRMVPSARLAFKRVTGHDPEDILPIQGGFCQYILSFQTATVPVPATAPEGFNPLHFVVAQPLGTIIRAVSKLGSLWGKRCAVLGCGQNGLLMTALLSGMGARVLIGLDLFENRVETAKAMGATHTVLVAAAGGSGAGGKGENAVEAVSRITEGALCDVVVDMVGHQGMWFENVI